MNIKLQRYSDNGNSTLGLLYMDTLFSCYTLEDTYRAIKIRGKTRIPASCYFITLRKEGDMNERYKKKFGKLHRGMLWIRDIENFEYVYLHVGNYPKDTLGCPLVGDEVNNNEIANGRVLKSTQAYTRIYTPIANSIENGEGTTINIVNY